jgi:hypothetical protein
MLMFRVRNPAKYKHRQGSSNFFDMDRDDFLEAIKIASKKNMKKLDLSNRDIAEIPDEIGILTELEELNLSYNSISNIPDAVSKMPKLKTLLLMRNQLERIPKSISGLQKLKLLDISHNRLNNLPEEIGELTELATLDASYCKIESLPVEMVNMLSLKSLYLENNPILFPDEKIVKRGLYATMHFLSEAKRNRDASKIAIQIFNLPKSMQETMRQYLDCFSDIVGTKNSLKLDFDINFIANEFEASSPAEANEKALHIISYLKKGIKEISGFPVPKDSMSQMAEEIADAKVQLNRLSTILEGKKNEISEAQAQLQRVSNAINSINIQ